MPAKSLTTLGVLTDFRRRLQKNIISPLVRVVYNKIPNSLYLDHIEQLSVSLTRVCNANCTFCSYQFLEKEYRQHMTDEVFSEVLKGIRKYRISNIQCSPNLGEPTLSPQFIERVRAMRNAGAQNIEITTNGTFLHRIGIDSFLDDGPNVINISFPGFDEEMYKRVYRSPHYRNTVNNILTLLRRNKEKHLDRQINLWIRGDIPTEEQLQKPEMTEALALGCGLSIMTEVDSWNGVITQEMLTGNMKLQSDIPIIQPRPCQLVRSITVAPDGTLHGCSCRNTHFDTGLYLGNIMSDDLMDAYSRLNPVFDRWKKGEYPDICQTCNMYCDPADGILGHLRMRFKRFSRGYFSPKTA